MRWSEKNKPYYYVRVELISFNDRWSYALDVTGHGCGYTFGARMKFCPPYPTRIDALRAAVEGVRRYLKSANSDMPGLNAWLESILEPVQLTMPGVLV